MMASIPDGRRFYLDRPHNTLCLLEKPEHCGFHNPSFPAFLTSLKAKAAENDSDEQIGRLIRNLLPDRWTSCVRQVLRCGITPFPYKVAKSLDADMYRNVEFEVWKAEQEANKRNDDEPPAIGIELRVGTKCLVKLRRSHLNMYNCCVEELPQPGSSSCLVFVEAINQQCMVSLDSLRAIQPKNHKGKVFLYIGSRKVPSHRNDMEVNDVVSSTKNDSPRKYSFKDYTNFDNFVPAAVQSITMPLSVEINGTPSKEQQQQQQQQQNAQPEGANTEAAANMGAVSLLQPQMVPQYVEPPHMGYYSHMEPWGYVSSDYHSDPQNQSLYSNSTHHSLYSAGYTSMNSTQISLPAPESHAVPFSLPFMIRRHDLLRSEYPINYGASPSYMPNGGDLPADVQTVRFFYNLGHELLQNFYFLYGPNCVQALMGTPIATTNPQEQPDSSVSAVNADNESESNDLVQDMASLSCTKKSEKKCQPKSQDTTEQRRDIKNSQNHPRPKNFPGNPRNNRGHPPQSLSSSYHHRHSPNVRPNHPSPAMSPVSPGANTTEKKQPKKIQKPQNQEQIMPLSQQQPHRHPPPTPPNMQPPQQLLHPNQPSADQMSEMSQLPQNFAYNVQTADGGVIMEPPLPPSFIQPYPGSNSGYNFYGAMPAHFMPMPSIAAGHTSMSPMYMNANVDQQPAQTTAGPVAAHMTTPYFIDDNMIGCYYQPSFYQSMPTQMGLPQPPHMHPMPYYIAHSNIPPPPHMISMPPTVNHTPQQMPPPAGSNTQGQ